MKLSELGTSVENLSGVGPATAKQFARLNIFTVADLLSVFPRDYEDRTRQIPLSQFSQGKVHTICKVISHQWFGYGNMKTLKIGITDGTASASLIAFNRAFLEKSLPQGSIISVTGSFDVKYGELQSTAFEATRLSYEGELEEWKNTPLADSGVLPVYPLTDGLSQKNYRKTIALALNKVAAAIDNEIPEEIISQRKLLSKSTALIYVHMPKTMEQVIEGRRTLIYEELFLFEKKMALRAIEHRGKLPTFDESGAFDGDPGLNSAALSFSQPEETEESLKAIRLQFEKDLSPRQKLLYKSLPFELTPHQINAIRDMNADIDKSQTECNTMINSPQSLERSPFSMQRLLQGDVGSGKTLVSFFVALRTIDYGGQAALMAPTELLARQHAENAAKLLGPLGIRAAFLTGNLKAKGRESLVNALKEGAIDLVIGTHALFSRNTSYKNLQLAIIDEQHRFGVAQRESIVSKGRISSGELFHTPDVLMMSATPIPQTLALTAFGDLDVSVIKTMPRGRKAVKTFLTVMGNEKNVYQAVHNELKAGHQAYFVYPRIGEGEESDGADDRSLKSAEDNFRFLSQNIFPEYKCALVHGKIDEEQQNEILDDFKENKIQILVATTVVEVGVDVPNATCIVIEHADRFGLAELHQLRGRVGRGSSQSYCFLTYAKGITETGIQRLKAIHSSTDGFVIAEEDLKLRGPGEVSGTAQSGYLALNIADLVRDKELLKFARYDVFKMLES